MDKHEALNILKQMIYNIEMDKCGFSGVKVKNKTKLQALKLAIKELEG